jgi:hypothetical protein
VIQFTPPKIFILWAVRSGAHNDRQGRRRRWSKALMRHGADARAALAEGLGVSAEDMRVRGRWGRAGRRCSPGS